MTNIFDQMPRLSYSRDLHAHLKGLDITCSGYTSGTTIYAYVLIVMFITALLITANFYYGIFNRPKFASAWAWLANVLAAAIIVFCTALMQASSDLRHSHYCKDLHFSTTDCMLFGFTAAAYTVLFCILISFIIKWRSLNNKKIPV